LEGDAPSGVLARKLLSKGSVNRSLPQTAAVELSPPVPAAAIPLLLDTALDVPAASEESSEFDVDLATEHIVVITVRGTMVAKGGDSSHQGYEVKIKNYHLFRLFVKSSLCFTRQSFGSARIRIRRL
jgi:hypothetical protein